MGKETPYVKIGAVVFVFALAAVMIGNYVGVPKAIPLTAYDDQQACISAGGTWENGACQILPQPPGYVPFTLANIYLNVMNALDKDATFGADDAKVRIYTQGAFDFTGPYLDSDGNAATTGQIDLSGDRMKTGTCYTSLTYQGDGGTNLYALKDDFCVPQLTGDKTMWSSDKNIYIYQEGAFSESALDSATDAFDESGDAVLLNKTAETVQGCLKWDFTVGNSVSGSHLKDPVLILEDSSSSPLTDLNDIESVYLSVKTGTGFAFPDGNLQTEFLSATPIHMTTDGSLGSADGGVGTLTVCLPAAESDVGTGSFLMHFDDLGDYRNRDLDNDVRAAAETTTFTIDDTV